MKVDMLMPLCLALLSVAAAHSQTVDCTENSVIFYENFDDTSDWFSRSNIGNSDDVPSNSPGEYRNGCKIDLGWTQVRSSVENWSPGLGEELSNYTIEILEQNSQKAYLGSGKSAVFWRESYNPGWNQWNTDGILAKKLSQGYEQIYVEFLISFGDDFTTQARQTGTSKLFRVASHEGPESLFLFGNKGDVGPIAFWDYSVTSYGLRNVLAFRGGPHGENYSMNDLDILNLPSPIINQGDLSLNYSYHTKNMGLDGSSPEIIDKALDTGELLDLNTDIVEHRNVFGLLNPGDINSVDNPRYWTKVAFFVKMNSSGTSHDGVLVQWIDDQVIFSNNSIRWFEGDTKPLWNTLYFGGNDFFNFYGNEVKHEEWYSIDNIKAMDKIPKYPESPINFSIN